MNTNRCLLDLTDYILSGHAYLYVPTTEKTRFLTDLNALAESLPGGGRQVFVWSHATGWQDAKGNPPESVQIGHPDPQKVAQEILNLPESSLIVLKDFGYYVQPKSYSYADVVIAWLTEIRDVLASSGRTVIFLGPEFDVPAPLANDVTTVDFALPDDSAIEDSVRFITEGHAIENDVLPLIVSACRGMTQQQVEDRTALALRRFKTLNGDAAKLILHEKAEVLRRSGLLRYLEPPEGGMGLIGGCEAVKAHIRRDKACFSDEAKAFGIDPPKGILLVGISGCGKTAISLSAAAELGMPLIQFDVGAMMSKWVGESERNVRAALQQIEAMAPCVVQMDEIEKGFGTVGSDGDSGAGMRAFGTVLKWMSERTCPAYLILTANDVTRLPPEFTRKGRIDEIFGVYLPTEVERRDILCIHLRQRQRDPEAFDLDAIAAATENYSGADIEQVVITGLKLAFHQGNELTTEHLLQAVAQVRPLSQTDPKRVAAMTEWLERHTSPAGACQVAGGSGKLNGSKKHRRVTP
ncbi:MAG: AAA family ATPase [Gammaproteobacteria bacterium]